MTKEELQERNLRALEERLGLPRGSAQEFADGANPYEKRVPIHERTGWFVDGRWND